MKTMSLFFGLAAVMSILNSNHSLASDDFVSARLMVCTLTQKANAPTEIEVYVETDAVDNKGRVTAALAKGLLNTSLENNDGKVIKFARATNITLSGDKLSASPLIMFNDVSLVINMAEMSTKATGLAHLESKSTAGGSAVDTKAEYQCVRVAP